MCVCACVRACVRVCVIKRDEVPGRKCMLSSLPSSYEMAPNSPLFIWAHLNSLKLQIKNVLVYSLCICHPYPAV